MYNQARLAGGAPVRRCGRGRPHAGELPMILTVNLAKGAVDEIPFDFVRRRLSVVVSRPDGKHILICLRRSARLGPPVLAIGIKILHQNFRTSIDEMGTSAICLFVASVTIFIVRSAFPSVLGLATCPIGS
jgi:hypothetical protein